MGSDAHAFLKVLDKFLSRKYCQHDLSLDVSNCLTKTSLLKTAHTIYIGRQYEIIQTGLASNQKPHSNLSAWQIVALSHPCCVLWGLC